MTGCDIERSGFAPTKLSNKALAGADNRTLEKETLDSASTAMLKEIGVFSFPVLALAYAELLKDPRWQRRRLEVLNAAKFACHSCRSTTETLHVHHLYYVRARKPWEYDDDALVCLCESCHALVTEQTRELLLRAGAQRWTLERVLGYARAVEALNYGTYAVQAADYPDVIFGISDYAGVDVSSSRAMVRPDGTLLITDILRVALR